MVCRCLLWFLAGTAVCAPAAAQPRSPEVFGLAGYARVNGDEGSLGSGLAAGGALTLPFARHWAIDTAVTHLRSQRDIGGFTWHSQHTHISPAIQYRWGSEALYGFAGFGAGVSAITRESGLHVHGRLGFVKKLSGRFVMRAEFFSVFRFVAPDWGVLAGGGYRF